MIGSQPHFRSLELAAYGWLPADWSQMFYPGGLPEDWQVSYYANEFDCVLLPAGGWISPATQASFWQGEVGSDFRFYLELTSTMLQSANWGQIREAVEKYLAPQVKGVLLPEAALDKLPAEWRSSFLLHVQRPGDWLTVTPAGAEAQTGLVRTEQILAAHALREIFEQLQAQTMHPDVTLFLDVPWGALEQFRLMKQLYGV